MRIRMNKKGDVAVLELAAFGTLIIMVVGVLVGYIQKVDARQAVKMQAFRAALERANPLQGPMTESPGASVRYFAVENTEGIKVQNLGGDGIGRFADGQTQRPENSVASVSWAVRPAAAYEAGDPGGVFTPRDATYVNVNGEEEAVAQLDNEFTIDTNTASAYSGSSNRQENPGSLTTTNTAQKKSEVANSFPGWDGRTQNSYYDRDGRVRFNSNAPDAARTKEETIWTPT